MADLIERNPPAVAAHQREIRQPRRIEPLPAGAAGYDRDIANVFPNLRHGNAGEEELQLPAHLRLREADEFESILIGHEAKHGCAIAPIAVRLPRTSGADSPVIVVDDGSTDGTSDAARAAGAEVIRHARNLGKATRCAAGSARCMRPCRDAAVCVDADG